MKKDFIRNVTNFGFSPFIELSFKEQLKKKNIMKYFNSSNYDFSQYIKKMNFLIHDKPKLKKSSNLKDNQNKIFKNKTSKFSLFRNRLKHSGKNYSSINTFIFSSLVLEKCF